MLYGFDETDVRRLRRLLQAYEQGKIRTDSPSAAKPTRDARDSYLVQAVATIPSNATGQIYLCQAVSGTTPAPPTVTALTTLDTTYTLFNDTGGAISGGSQFPAVREPTSGLWLPASSGNPPAWVKVTSATLQTIYLGGRQVMDGVTANTSAIITSATANFTSADVNKAIAGAGIPASTTILSVQSATQATLSANATATATGVTLNIAYTSTLSVYPAQEYAGATAWLEPINSLDVPSTGRFFFCELYGQDDANKNIWQTSDYFDASATQKGVVNDVEQAFAGTKTFKGGSATEDLLIVGNAVGTVTFGIVLDYQPPGDNPIGIPNHLPYIKLNNGASTPLYIGCDTTSPTTMIASGDGGAADGGVARYAVYNGSTRLNGVTGVGGAGDEHSGGICTFLGSAAGYTGTLGG